MGKKQQDMNVQQLMYSYKLIQEEFGKTSTHDLRGLRGDVESSGVKSGPLAVRIGEDLCYTGRTDEVVEGRKEERASGYQEVLKNYQETEKGRRHAGCRGVRVGNFNN